MGQEEFKVEKLLKPQEAAAILNISIKTLWKHVRFGRIQYVMIGNGSKRAHRRFTEADIRTFIRAQEE